MSLRSGRCAVGVGLRLPALLAPWALLVLLGCGASIRDSGRLLGIEGRDREALDALYPQGTPRMEVQERVSSPLVFSVRPCERTTREADASLGLAVDAFREIHPDTDPRCDIVRVARTGWGTLVGAVGLYQDYVFYDADERILIAYRAFLHRSGLD